MVKFTDWIYVHIIIFLTYTYNSPSKGKDLDTCLNLLDLKNYRLSLQSHSFDFLVDSLYFIDSLLVRHDKGGGLILPPPTRKIRGREGLPPSAHFQYNASLLPLGIEKLKELAICYNCYNFLRLIVLLSLTFDISNFDLWCFKLWPLIFQTLTFDISKFDHLAEQKQNL